MIYRKLVALALLLGATTVGCTLDAPVVRTAPPPPANPAPSGQPAPPSPMADPMAGPMAAPMTDPKVLGPLGYGDLTLGTSRADAFAKGLLTPPDTSITLPAGCTLHHLAGLPGPNQVAVYASPRGGIVQIGAAPDWRTPEQIGIGSTLAQVKAAYWDLAQQVNEAEATVPGNPEATYRFLFDRQGKVTEFALALRGQECTN